MSVKTATELKGLTTQLDKAKGELSAVQQEKRDISRKESELNKRINNLTQEINQLSKSKSNDIIISEHAILRYIDRVMGLETEKISEELFNKLNKYKTLRNFTDKIDGFKYIIKDGVLVTIE